MEVIKAGCYLIDKLNKKIAIIYREKQKDYTFPKGHKEDYETIEECAKRETEEETKRNTRILLNYKPYIERYNTKNQEKCICYMYFALDQGISKNTSQDTHKLLWIDIDEVENILSYESLKESWSYVKDNIKEIVNNDDYR